MCQEEHSELSTCNTQITGGKRIRCARMEREIIRRKDDGEEEEAAAEARCGGTLFIYIPPVF